MVSSDGTDSQASAVPSPEDVRVVDRALRVARLCTTAPWGALPLARGTKIAFALQVLAAAGIFIVLSS